MSWLDLLDCSREAGLASGSSGMGTMKTPVDGLAGMMRAFGREMAALRKSRRLSQEALAEATGLSLNTISNVERGVLDPTVTVVALMQVKLGSIGLELAKDHFSPLPDPLPDRPLPFPDLAIQPAAIVMTIGSVVRERRVGMGLTKEQLARMADIHVNTLQNLESGLVAPTISTLFKIYRELGVKRVLGTPSGIVLE